MRGLDMNDFCTVHMYLANCTIQSRMMVQLEYTYILWRTGAVTEFIFYTAFRTILLLLVPNWLIKRPDSKQKSYICKSSCHNFISKKTESVRKKQTSTIGQIFLGVG